MLETVCAFTAYFIMTIWRSVVLFLWAIGHFFWIQVRTLVYLHEKWLKYRLYKDLERYLESKTEVETFSSYKNNMISVQGAGLGPSWNLGQAKMLKQRSNPWNPIQLSFRDLLLCYSPTAWQEARSTGLFLISFYKRREDNIVRDAQWFGKKSSIQKMHDNVALFLFEWPWLA